jgi:hypothetical protein
LREDTRCQTVLQKVCHRGFTAFFIKKTRYLLASMKIKAMASMTLCTESLANCNQAVSPACKLHRLNRASFSVAGVNIGFTLKPLNSCGGITPA